MIRVLSLKPLSRKMYFSCFSCVKNVIGLYWYGVGVTHKIVREPVINNHSEVISRTSLGFSIS